MPRSPRFAPGGYVYHALKRAVARLPLFDKDGDFAAFERVEVEAQARCPIRILGVCLMPNHWHFVLWPVPTPRAWIERVHQPETEAEREAPRRAVARSQPFGRAAWQEQTAERLGLQSSFRAPGRPRKQTGKARQ